MSPNGVTIGCLAVTLLLDDPDGTLVETRIMATLSAIYLGLRQTICQILC